ncbi:MAG TPA: S1C family serine protease [bacterium]|nr:S1C family serine protease [bacterium]
MNLSISHKKVSSSLVWWILTIIINLGLAIVLIKYYFTLEQANFITANVLSGQSVTGWPMAIHDKENKIKKIAIDYNEAASLAPTLESSVIKFFEKTAVVTTSLKGDLYNLDRPLASAWVVTNDGWLVSASELKDLNEVVAISSNDRSYKIKTKVVDPLTGLFFYRLDQASNLASVKLGESGWSRPGQLFYGLDGRGGLKAIWLERINQGNENMTIDASELLARWQFSNSWPNAAIFNGQGDLFGLTNGQNKFIPVNYIKSGLTGLLTKNSFKRINLGLEYIDLNRLSADKSGLLISEVEADGVAEKAGIKKGDIILSVDEINLNGEITLNEILQSYQIGGRSVMVIQRDNQNRQVNCQF